MKRKATCPKCGQTFDMGYNGTIDGCDDCTGVLRDRRDHVWLPADTVHVLVDFEGNLDEVIMRPVDLRKAKR